VDVQEQAETRGKTTNQGAAMPKKKGPVARLPEIRFVGEKALPPQVQLEFEMEDEDYAELQKTALANTSSEEVGRLVLEDFLRKALIEFAESLPETPAPRKRKVRK
jgi:hypothetical protein